MESKLPAPSQVDSPNIELGFVILSHVKNPLLARLLSKLNELYNFPPIVIHHDFFQSVLPFTEAQLTSNITILRSRKETRWADFSIVDAFLSGLEKLYEKHSPDWFCNLSASCYPVSLGTRVRSELAETNFDAFLGHAAVSAEGTYPPESEVQSIGEILLSPSLPTHTSDVNTWLDMCYRRYVATERSGTLFNSKFKCFAGDQWFTANAKAARKLLNARHENRNLVRHYMNVHVPDESFCQTVLCNDSDLNICESNRRFVNWHTPGAHPLDLTQSNFEMLVASGCHFARKFSLPTSGTVLDCLERLHLDATSVQPTASFTERLIDRHS